MLRLLNKRKIKGMIFIIQIAVSALSCGFIDLRPINLNIYPDKQNTILSGIYSPIILKFDTEMNKMDAEGLLQVSSDSGIISGDYSWKNNDLYFTPVSGWTPGLRYTLNLAGTVRSRDGRELRIQKSVSFYAVNDNDPPLLERHYPADGEEIGTGNIFLEFQFSVPMDRLTTESAVSVEGIGNKFFEWSQDDKNLRVYAHQAGAADKPLAAWNFFRWNLKNTAKSKDGVPLPKTYSGSFSTTLDQVLPQVTDVFPVINAGGQWYPTGLDIKDGLGSGQAIAVEFNKPMGDNALRSIRFEPSLAGRTEMLTEKSVVFIPAKDPEPQTVYTMIISSDTRDSEGLKTGVEYRLNFTPDIPFLEVLSLSFLNGNQIEGLSSINYALPLVTEPATGNAYISIRFSLSFKPEEQKNIAQKIILVPFFPSGLKPIGLEKAGWFSKDIFYMHWTGLHVSDTEVPHFYKLVIPGGKGGITSDSGIYMKEDLIIFLEAVYE